MIKIVGEKVVSRGVKCIRIKEVVALGINDLPDEYTENEPAVWLQGRYLHHKGYGPLVATGDLIRETRFNDHLEFIRKCGDRLKTINDQLKVENKDWHGELEVRI